MSVNVVAAFNEAVDARDLDRLDAWRNRNVFDDVRQVRTDRVRRWQVDDA